MQQLQKTGFQKYISHIINIINWHINNYSTAIIVRDTQFIRQTGRRKNLDDQRVSDKRY